MCEKDMRKEYIAVIQAGGRGNRMLALTQDRIPKPMLKLNGKPLLEWQIENISKYGITEFVIIIGHLGEIIKEYFGDGRRLHVHISYIEETMPLGSAGALYYLKDSLGEKDFLLIFGDVMFDLEWSRMIQYHENHGSRATLLVHPNAHPFDSDLVLMNDAGVVCGIDAKNSIRDYWYDNCVNAGIYILSGSILDKISKPERLDLEKDLLISLIKTGCVYGYRTPEYVKDVGTPERFYKAAEEQERGVWENKCLKNKQKCIFLDRDGTINQFRGLISNEIDFELEDNAAEAIRQINESGYLAIVITNQPVVARGKCSINDVENIHHKMMVKLGEKGCYLDDIAFCPHHPDKGYPEENPVYKVKCDCRKPATGMIDEMVERYNIDLEQSYFVGDSTVDIQTGKNANLKTILVLTGLAGEDKKYDVKPDYVAKDILEAVNMILSF